jgi:hypothetical protein
VATISRAVNSFTPAIAVKSVCMLSREKICIRVGSGQWNQLDKPHGSIPHFVCERLNHEGYRSDIVGYHSYT